jgi:peptidylprolyl isomerase/FKBP-type peptidyl-prolyl cis-trans isomerase FklB
MKKLAGAVLACILVFPAAIFAEDAKKESVKIESFEEKLGYSMGLDVGNYFKGIGEEISFEALVQGLEDAFQGTEPRLSAEEIAAVQQKFGEQMQAKQQEQLQKMQEENKKLGADFLEENKKKEGVVTTESGLQYEVLKKGDGEKPQPSDQVKVDYVGTLIDGTEFDSSIKRGEPAIFRADQVIPGWSEALQLMEVGSKYRLVIPAELAYGEKGAPPVIEPNSVLIFEVDLLGIEKE